VWIVDFQLYWLLIFSCILSEVAEKLNFKLYSPNTIYFIAICAFWKTFKRCPINISNWIRVEMFTSLGNGATLLVTRVKTNGARTIFEFLQNGRYGSIWFEVKYSSLLSKNRRIDLLLIEFVRLRASLPESTAFPSLVFGSMLSIISRERGESRLLVRRLSVPFFNIFSTFMLKNMNGGIQNLR